MTSGDGLSFIGASFVATSPAGAIASSASAGSSANVFNLS